MVVFSIAVVAVDVADADADADADAADIVLPQRSHLSLRLR